MNEDIGTTPEAEAPEVSERGFTEDEAAQELLRRMSPKAKDAEPDAESGPGDDAQEPKDDGHEDDSDASNQEGGEQSQEASEAKEVDIGGEKFKIPAQFAEVAQRMSAKAKEVEAGATRKFQEASELRKSAESRLEAVQQVEQLTQEQLDIAHDMRLVNARLQHVLNVEIGAARAEGDHAKLVELNAEALQLQQAGKDLSQRFNSAVTKLNESKAAQREGYRREQAAIVANFSKDWTAERKSDLYAYAAKRGIDVEKIQDAWMIQALDDAAYGAKVRESKPHEKRQPLPPSKTLAPGVAQRQTGAQAQAGQAMGRLKKSGSIEDATSALLALSKASRKR